MYKNYLCIKITGYLKMLKRSMYVLTLGDITEDCYSSLFFTFLMHCLSKCNQNVKEVIIAIITCWHSYYLLENWNKIFQFPTMWLLLYKLCYILYLFHMKKNRLKLNAFSFNSDRFFYDIITFYIFRISISFSQILICVFR